MFKIKKESNRLEGKCLAARCTTDAIPGAPIALCNEHGQAWQEGGSPSLEDMQKRPARSTAITVLAENDPDNVAAEIEPIRLTAEQQLQTLASVEIVTQAQCDWLKGAALLVKQQIAALETMRMQRKRPHLDRGNAIDAQFRPAGELLGKCDQICVDKMRAFELARLDARDTALAASPGVGAGPDVLAAVQAPNAIADSVFNAPVVWRWELEDINLVPQQYTKITLVDELVDLYVKHKGGDAVIPGIKVFRDVDVKLKRGALNQ